MNSGMSRRALFYCFMNVVMTSDDPREAREANDKLKQDKGEAEKARRKARAARAQI